MKPPVRYYGGKAGLASWIASLLPSHRVYVEPLCGSAAVLFAKAPSTHEILNDVDGHIVNFLRALREQPDELERLCRLTPYARDEYAATTDLDDPTISDLERARRWWAQSSQSFGQIATTGTGWSTSIQRGSNNARSAWNRLDRFADAATRLGPVTIENLDALEVIDRYGTADGTIYCDPPYLGSTRRTISGRRPRGDYLHEFATEADHRALAAVLRTSPAAILLSGYPSDLYAELYHDWWSVSRRVRPRMANARRISGVVVTEMVWSNRPILDGRLFSPDATGQPPAPVPTSLRRRT